MSWSHDYIIVPCCYLHVYICNSMALKCHTGHQMNIKSVINVLIIYCTGWMSFSTGPWWLLHLDNYKLYMYLFICFYATGRTLKVHLNIIHVSFFELMHGWELLQLLVIINYLVLFIEYAYQTLVVYPMLYRYHLILLLYFVIFFYCYIVLCVYITHCTHIFNHCNDLALNDWK